MMKTMHRETGKSAVGMALLSALAAAMLFMAGQAQAADKPGKVEKVDPLASYSTEVLPPLTLLVNKSTILRLETPAARVAVGNPAVADITPINPKEIYVLGKAAGATNLIIWSKGGVASMMDVKVIPEPVVAQPLPEAKDTVEVIKGLDKSQLQF